jgi:hypothetical protein
VAKAALPYRRIIAASSSSSSSNNTNLDDAFDKADFVFQKLQERQSLRTEKRFDEADRISAGLLAMGIVLDDILKTWQVGDAATPTINPMLNGNEQQEKNSTATSLDITITTTTGVACQFCQNRFASRNLMFKHLRDTAISGWLWYLDLCFESRS